MNSIYETVSSLVYLSSLKKIIDRAEMVDSLINKAPFTLFAPYNGAFSAYTTYDPNDLLHYYIKADLDKLLASKAMAKDAINGVLVEGRLTLEDLTSYNSVTALNGRDISIVTTNGTIIPQNSFLLNSDIECTNGIIHVTDELLQP